MRFPEQRAGLWCRRGSCRRSPEPGRPLCAEHLAQEVARKEAHAARVKADPVRLAEKRRRSRESQRAARATPEGAEASRAMVRRYYERTREEQLVRMREQKLKRNYGLTIAAFEEMLQSQGGGCAICRTTDPRGKGVFHVDHCHETGKVRGLLCHFCNLMLGNGADSADRLRAGAAYLDRHPKTASDARAA